MFMNINRKSTIIVFIISLFFLLSSMAWAADLSMGIGIIKDRNTELLLGEQNYELILKKAYDAFDRAFLPVLIVDSEYIHDDALQFLDAVVFVSTSAIDECIKEPLRQFKENGGIVTT